MDLGFSRVALALVFLFCGFASATTLQLSNGGTAIWPTSTDSLVVVAVATPDNATSVSVSVTVCDAVAFNVYYVQTTNTSDTSTLTSGHEDAGETSSWSFTLPPTSDTETVYLVGIVLLSGLFSGSAPVYFSVTNGSESADAVAHVNATFALSASGSTEMIFAAPSSLNASITGSFVVEGLPSGSTICSLPADRVSATISLVDNIETEALVWVKDLNVNTTYQVYLTVSTDTSAGEITLGPVVASTKPIANCFINDPDPTVSFCTPYNSQLINAYFPAPSIYVGYVSDNTTIADIDAAGSENVQNFAGVVYLYPCESNDPMMAYSFVRTCSDCVSAYALWYCSRFMPACSDEIVSPTTADDLQYVALTDIYACYNVSNSCPVTTGFLCPHQGTPAANSYNWTVNTSPASLPPRPQMSKSFFLFMFILLVLVGMYI